jgi:hypothetical protein
MENIDERGIFQFPLGEIKILISPRGILNSPEF